MSDISNFEKLNNIVPEYAKNKSNLDSVKKVCDRLNSEIKELMLSEGINDYSAGGFTAKISISEKFSFDEELLLKKIKNLSNKGCNTDGIIKTKEYVDMDELENALYHEKINPAELADCQIKKETITLRIK